MKLSKNGLVVETSLPREQVQLQAAGFVPVPEYDNGGVLAAATNSVLNDTGEAVAILPRPSPKPGK